MKTLSNIKKDMEFNNGLSSLIETLKTISVAQFRALEQKIKAYEKFDLTFENFLKFIDLAKINHPFLKPSNRLQIVIAVTSDSGLLGGLNMMVVNTAIQQLKQIPGKLVIVGERGRIYAREAGIPFAAFSGIKDEERYSQAMQLRNYVLGKVYENSAGYLKVIYSHPVSLTVQEVRTVSFLPFSEKPKDTKAAKEIFSEVIFESDPGDIVEYLLYLYMGQKLYDIFGLSRLAEFAARFMHLEESSQRLKDMDKKVRLEYFRVRHELIDRNMRELFSARLLFVSKH
ncbi:MAG: F0F1 ATP synthase subunit gamma [Candidatus Omnitrophica bacterium]|nr:F0F1 ATP synthase subunit gamma [Candidatus Omnitrophota bacterium]